MLNIQKRSKSKEFHLEWYGVVIKSLKECLLVSNSKVTHQIANLLAEGYQYVPVESL